MIFGRSVYDKAVKDDKKAARKEARDEKKEAQKDAREAKKEARQEKGDSAKEARQDKRDAAKDAREEKRDAMKAIRQSDLKGEDKREVKRDVRQDKRDELFDARSEKKTEVKDARETKKDAIDEAKETKKAEIDEAKAEKKAALDALRVPKAFDRKWKSYLVFQEVDAVEIFKPRNLEDLQSILRVAAELKMKVRAIGSGHSFSDIGVTNDFFVETKGFNRFLPLTSAERARRFKPEHHDAQKSKLAELEVGIEILELSKELDKLGLALVNQGTFDGQTFWGAVSTSTHGTGLRRPPFPDMVRSVVLVTEGGRTLRIEPRDGITQPKGWHEAGIDELVQDDDTFYSVICSMGCMGIVYSVVIQPREMYWIDEWSYFTTWEEFRREFEPGDRLKAMLDKWEMFSLLVSPLHSKKGKKDGVDFRGEHAVSILIREESTQRRPIGDNREAEFAATLEHLGFMAFKRPHDAKFAIVPKLVKDSSKLAVLQYGRHPWEGESADQTSHAPDRRLKCYEMFPQGGKVFGGFAIEVAFHYSETFRVMDRIIELAEQSVARGRRHTAPVAIRYVAPSHAYASPQYGRETVMFEVLMVKGTPQGKETLEDIERELLKLPGVRIHWGLQMGVMSNAGDQLRKMYPRWDAWMSVYRRFNAGGTFNNKFTDRLGISQ
jgi:hypothetical protein